MKELMTFWSVPADSILLETDSENTYENALFTKKILDERGIKKVILVTSALHMRRSYAIFKTLNIDVIPIATDYEVVDDGDHSILMWLPSATSLDGTTRALHEYIGYLVYRCRGWIDD